ncbi:TIGR03557 family F420-dependent LLM class oxidoreductase [Streptomyces sp. A7024]|uniref:TIGR03557 family F420-dependent LLM class oxidoreductase n=1 Tax=Streptomyces coryli TaxID=1128680 RepID=A0A6G4U7Y8_9ACTN|nr:TIGR03557 family F420-dependent LLM class oxidoreductase [Streptomyces coryli]NGN68349.1 TIGR03557 family F420-dependent LLM class oxidoreductase [Streptomyces coryli]
MTEYGYFLAAEEHGPRELVEQARMAEQAGFTSLWISDHFHPWTGDQGESPFVWSVIGAISEATSLPVQTAVTCPTVRIHPAIIAQAAATSALLNDGFRLGVGSGEALNEHVLGDRWPPAPVRLEMLEEAVTVIRRLLSGEEITHYGKHYTVENARIYSLPDQPVPIDVSAFGPAAVEVAGRIGDGLITMMPDTAAIERFRKSGGGQKPVRGGTKVCYGPNRQEAIRTVRRLWPNIVIPGELAQVLPSPAHFEQAAEQATESALADAVVCGDDPDQHVAALKAYEDAGFDSVYVNQIGPHQQAFFDFYRSKVLPQLAG